jgi:lysophospholipase L1-like esterase
MKNWFINIGLLLGSLVLFFAGTEAALRITGLQTTKPNPPRIYQASPVPEISYELKPGIRERAYRATVTTNSRGFRGPEINREKPLIAVLGDSVTFGYGIEDAETMPAKLQELLPAFHVLNTAVPGYHMGQQLATYREKVMPLEPDALIIVYHFNDLIEDTGWLDDQGVLRSEEDRAQARENRCDPIEYGILGLLPGRCWLDLHSAFYRAVKKFVNQRYGRELSVEQRVASRTNPFDDNVTEEELAAYARKLSELTILLPPSLPRLFVIWPERFLHFPSRPKIRAIAEREGFAVLDLYEFFGNEPEMLPWDQEHPSPKTTAETAAIIAAALEYYELLPHSP